MLLVGMKEIAQYCLRTPPTIIEWILRLEFPAYKMGGIWEAETEEIVEWKEKIKGESCHTMKNIETD